MIYVIAFSLIFLVVIIIELTDSREEKVEGSAPNAMVPKKCPCCAGEIEADAMKCRSCGAFINIF
jgi:hypothetical protein